MKKIKVKKALFYGLVFIVSACSNDLELENQSKRNEFDGIQVVELDGTNLKSRSVEAVGERSLSLKFRDELIYRATIEKLKRMTPEERIAFFEKLGFEGTYSIWEKANKELDEIFDKELSLDSFTEEISAYKKRFEGVFIFNNEDVSDATPYLPFVDEDLALVGDIEGKVYVGERKIQPILGKISFDRDIDKIEEETDYKINPSVAPIPTAYTFRSFKHKSVIVRNGKYRSKMIFGSMRTPFDIELATKFEAQKKWLFFWKKSSASHTWKLSLTIPSLNISINSETPIPHRLPFCYLPLTLAATKGNPMIITVHEFSSSRGKAKASAVLKNIYPR